MVKLMENTYRDVNIALANEFSHLAERFEVDVWRAIELANLHPRVEVLRPGPGVGGHCIGIDPWFLVEAAPESTALIHQSRLINDSQPTYVTAQIQRALGGSVAGKTVAALGLAYKAGVDDLRESPAIRVVQELVAAGADVRTFEPIATQASVEGAKPSPSLKEALAGAEGVLLLVDHPSLAELSPPQAAELMAGNVAVDLRGAWPRQAWREAGFQLYVLGVGKADG
jgi:UDP-N-acetyl-D-mannosaminuronic acid dehydrogenase